MGVGAVGLFLIVLGPHGTRKILLHSALEQETCARAESLRVSIAGVEFHFPSPRNIDLRGKQAPDRAPGAITDYCQGTSEAPFIVSSAHLRPHPTFKHNDLLYRLGYISIDQSIDKSDAYLLHNIELALASGGRLEPVAEAQNLLLAKEKAKGASREQWYVTEKPGLFGRPAAFRCRIVSNPMSDVKGDTTKSCVAFIPIAKNLRISAQFFAARVPYQEWNLLVENIERWVLSRIPPGETDKTYLSSQPESIFDLLETYTGSRPHE